MSLFYLKNYNNTTLKIALKKEGRSCSYGLFLIFVPMKKVFHKIASLCLALLLLASTTSWTVEQHYCMGRLMDTAFFTTAEDCGMGLADNASDEKEIMPCCDDEVSVIDGQDNLKISLDDLSLGEHLFISVYTYTYLNLFEGLEEHIVPFNQYPPPILIADIQLLDQVFLI